MQRRLLDRGSVRPLSPRKAREEWRNRRREGVATVEAVIMLPVLGSLLVGTIFIGRLYLAHGQALVVARACAFEYAVRGCHDVPLACPNLPRSVQDPDGRNRSTAIVAKARADVGGAFDVFEKVPILGAALSSLFGTTARAVIPVELRLPWTERDSIRGNVQLALACNEHPRGVTEEIQSMLREYLPVLK